MNYLVERIRDKYARVSWSIKSGLGTWVSQKLADAAKTRGYFLIKENFYVPLPSQDELHFAKQCTSAMKGLDLDFQRFENFFRETLNFSLTDFRRNFPLRKSSAAKPQGFYLLNSTYMVGDAHLYYGVVRQRKPKRMIEIGAGNSTQLALKALAENFQETGERCEFTIVEPYAQEWMRQLQIPSVKFLEKKIQEIPLEFFESLSAGDILFIDSAHTVVPGGDVIYEICEIIPRLKPGVLVHVHDISLPDPYPEAYAKHHWYWTEQYLLQAFLAFNKEFSVVWPSAYMWKQHKGLLNEYLGEEIKEMIKEFPSAVPSSFWFQRNV